MKKQRGVVLLITLVLSLLLALLAAQVLSEAQARQWLVSEQVAAAQAFELAEAGLLEGAALLGDGLPPPCTQCLPPSLPPAEPVLPWRKTLNAFVLLQNLGQSTRAAGLAPGERVTLVRVTAISPERRHRQVLEAVYALGDAQPPRRISWRQRVHEG